MLAIPGGVADVRRSSAKSAKSDTSAKSSQSAKSARSAKIRAERKQQVQQYCLSRKLDVTMAILIQNVTAVYIEMQHSINLPG